MSTPDPEALYRRLASGDAGRVEAATDTIVAAASALERARDSAAQGRSTAASAWQGTAADAFAGRAQLTGTAADTAHTRLLAAVQILRSVADSYRTMSSTAATAIQVWRDRPADLAEPARTQLATRVTRELGTLRDTYESALRTNVRSLDALVPAFAETAGDTGPWQRTTLMATPSLPPPGSDPRAVAQWWAGLSETERDQLLATEFERLGRLRGLPADVLDAANRRRVEVDRARLTAERADLDAQIERLATELGLDPDDEGALRAHPELADLLDERQDINLRLDNAIAVQDNIERAERQDVPGGVFVLSYDPVGPNGDGALAIAFGNPDTADHLAVLVPGTGTSVSSGFPVDSAADLRLQMDSAGSGQNATIAWLGYDAPDSLADLDVAQSENARDGGATLVSDVDGYRAAAEAAGNHQHVTVIGHSYGSTTVGYASMDGLAADDVAFIGSPGVGASHVDQLAPGAGHVWAGAAEHDPVVQLTQGEWFTDGPSSTSVYDEEFGATVFGTPDGGGIAGAHSSYYEPGSESLSNLGNIATGNYDQVTDQRWQDDPLPDSPLIEGADVAHEVVTGVWEAGGHVVDGDLGGAWDEIQETGGEVVSDGLDIVVGGVGGAVETGHDVYDNTIGRIPGL